MRVYLEPDTSSRGIMRVRDALIRYLPDGFTVVDDPSDSDLEVIHVWGRHDSVIRRAEKIKRSGRKYAVIQYVLRSSQKHSTYDWMWVWQNAEVVWSYYDLNKLAVEDGYWDEDCQVPPFNFYYAPLGVYSNIFHDVAEDTHVRFFISANKKKLSRQYAILATSQHALSEGARECAFAVKRVKRRMIFVGHELRRGPEVVCVQNISDKELAQYYSNSDFVSGLRTKEGFELPVIEGALCGARPIVYDRPEMRHWFGDFAVFVPENTRESLIDHLESIFKQDIPQVTEEEKEMIRVRFDWWQIISNFWKQIS